MASNSGRRGAPLSTTTAVPPIPSPTRYAFESHPGSIERSRSMGRSLHPATDGGARRTLRPLTPRPLAGSLTPIMPGKYFEDLAPGQRYRHTTARTITEADNTLFCALTMNTQPLHVNAEFAAKSEFGQRIVNGIFTLGLLVGLTVSDLTDGTIVANLSYDRVVHPR